MSVETFIQAMPKVDLHVQLEGAASRDLVLMIAEQNDIASTYKKRKQYDDWVDLLKEPTPKQLDEILRESTGWVRHPDDLARVVYDYGVGLAKQNVKYAEVSVIPAIYTDLGLTFQQVVDGLNDGADRVLRGWQVRLNWLMAMPRERPRKSDDISRWATSVTAQKGNIVGLTLVGRESEQPIAQFRKAFNTAAKKDIARVTHVYSEPDADSFEGVMEVVQPTRVTDAWGLIEDEEAMAYLQEHEIPVLIAPMREIFLGRIESIAEYPLRQLLDHGVPLILGSQMPEIYGASLTDVLISAVQEADLTVDEIQQMMLRALQAALLPEDEKTPLIEEFETQFAALRDEHLTGETE
jgi:adenosine deaminase